VGRCSATLQIRKAGYASVRAGLALSSRHAVVLVPIVVAFLADVEARAAGEPGSSAVGVDSALLHAFVASAVAALIRRAIAVREARHAAV